MPKMNRTTEQLAAFENVIKAGGSIKDAKLAAGYSKNVANKGITGLPNKLLKSLIHNAKEFQHIGTQFSPDERKAIVRGKAISNVLQGKDESVQSLKILGQDSEVGMFQPETVIGIFAQVVPKGFEDYITLDAEQLKP